MPAISTSPLSCFSLAEEQTWFVCPEGYCRSCRQCLTQQFALSSRTRPEGMSTASTRNVFGQVSDELWQFVWAGEACAVSGVNDEVYRLERFGGCYSER